MMNFFERFGSYYNGHLNEARVRATYRANERLSFSFSEEWDRFRLPVPGGDFSVVVGVFKRITHSRVFLLSPRSFRWIPQAGKLRVPTFACAGIIVPTVICTLS